MKVILTTNVKGQGSKGDIVEVKDGYGKNFLINKGLAIIANEENLKQLKRQRNLDAKELEKDALEANQKKVQLEKTVLKFKMKTGKNDQVFGSVSSKQIVDALQNQGIIIDKKKISANAINSIGIHNVKIELLKGIVAILKVELIKES